MTDYAREFRSHNFGRTVAALGTQQLFTRLAQPQTNGRIERVHGTILDQC